MVLYQGAVLGGCKALAEVDLTSNKIGDRGATCLVSHGLLLRKCVRVFVCVCAAWWENAWRVVVAVCVCVSVCAVFVCAECVCARGVCVCGVSVCVCVCGERACPSGVKLRNHWCEFSEP